MSANLQRWLCTVPEDYFPESVWGAFDAIVGRVAWTDSSPILRGDVLRLLGDVGGVLVWPLDQVDAEFLAAAPRLRVISTIGTGVDHIDLAAATARGIPVCHTPGLNVDAVADHTFALMLAVARRLAEQGRLQREGRSLEVHRQAVFGRALTGSTLGLVGLGAIGAAVARRARLRHARALREPEPKTGPGDGAGLEWMASTTSCDRRTSCRCTRRSPRRRAA